MGGGLTISPAIRGQKNGVADEVLSWASVSGGPFGGWQAASSWPVGGQTRASLSRSARAREDPLPTPTSTGQVPVTAEMVTLRAGTCRVSPWTHVMEEGFILHAGESESAPG